VDLLRDLPAWLFAPLTLVFFVGTSIAGLTWARHWSRGRGLHALVDNSAVGWIFSGILVIYAIVIGLVAIETWDNLSDAAKVASQEAAEIAVLYRDFGGYPQPVQGELRPLLVRYTHNVIEVSWPAQRRGLVPSDGTDVLNELHRAMIAFEPATDGQRIVHAGALNAFNRLTELRRQRLEAVGWGVPGTLWTVVLLGAALAIVASYVISMESFFLHALMTGLLAAMIGLLVYFIASCDRPYQGAIAVEPTAYEIVLHDLMER
jgi:hypothetical protein